MANPVTPLNGDRKSTEGSANEEPRADLSVGEVLKDIEVELKSFEDDFIKMTTEMNDKLNDVNKSLEKLESSITDAS